MPIFRAEHVVPVTAEPIKDGAVVFQNGRIVRVGAYSDAALEYPEETVRDFGKAAIIPGLVNCHSHLELTGFRGSVDHYDGEFTKWLYQITKLRANRDSVDEIELSALLGACEGAAGGVTTFGDIGRVGTAGVRALQKTGLRGVVFQETEFSPSASTAASDFEQLKRKFEKLAETQTNRVRVGISPHAPYTVSAELFEMIAGFSISKGVPISIHAAESEAETELMKDDSGEFKAWFERESVDWTSPHVSTIRFLSRIGVLDAKPLLAHCIRVSDEELELIAKSGSRVAHCPKSNAKFGHGAAPIPEFLRRGVIVGLGSDSMASNNTCDLFEEARFAGLLARVVDSGSEFLSAERLLFLATMGGAQALGMESEIGSLEAGKQADLTVISVDGIGQLPVYDVCSTLVFSTSSAAVIETVVAGKSVYFNGDVINVDVPEIKARASRVFSL